MLGEKVNCIVPQSELPVTRRIGVPIGDGRHPTPQQRALHNVVGKSRHGERSQWRGSLRSNCDVDVDVWDHKQGQSNRRRAKQQLRGPNRFQNHPRIVASGNNITWLLRCSRATSKGNYFPMLRLSDGSRHCPPTVAAWTPLVDGRFTSYHTHSCANVLFLLHYIWFGELPSLQKLLLYLLQIGRADYQLSAADILLSRRTLFVPDSDAVRCAPRLGQN